MYEMRFTLFKVPGEFLQGPSFWGEEPGSRVEPVVGGSTFHYSEKVGGSELERHTVKEGISRLVGETKGVCQRSCVTFRHGIP